MRAGTPKFLCYRMEAIVLVNTKTNKQINNNNKAPHLLCESLTSFILKCFILTLKTFVAIEKFSEPKIWTHDLTHGLTMS